MVRSLTSSATTEAEKAMGAEPVVILKIEWGGTVGTRYYAGKQVAVGAIVTRPSLLDIAELAWQLKQHETGSVSSFTVRLDDSEDDLRQIITGMAVENRSASVLLYFEGTGESDVTTLIKGKLVSPIEWAEGERVLTFTVESFVSESEVGYAPREEDIPSLPRESDGKAWPMCFGSPLLVPAVRVQKRGETVLTRPWSALWYVDRDHGNNLTVAGDTVLYVEDGSDFPQGTCAVNVGGLVVRGVMGGNTFIINSLDVGFNLPKYDNVRFASRPFNDPDRSNAEVVWLSSYIPIVGHFVLMQPGSMILGSFPSIVMKVVKQVGTKVWLSEKVPDGAGGYILLSSDAFPAEVSMVPRYGWPFQGTEDLPSGMSWYNVENGSVQGIKFDLSAGTKVFAWEDHVSVFSYTYADVWICNAIPSSAIYAIYAEKDGVLTPIPSQFYQKWPSVTLFNQACA